MVIVLPPASLPYLPDPTPYQQLLSPSLQLSKPSPVAPRVPGGLCPPGVPQGPLGGEGLDSRKDSESGY